MGLEGGRHGTRLVYVSRRRCWWRRRHACARVCWEGGLGFGLATNRQVLRCGGVEVRLRGVRCACVLDVCAHVRGLSPGAFHQTACHWPAYPLSFGVWSVVLGVGGGMWRYVAAVALGAIICPSYASARQLLRTPPW